MNRSEKKRFHNLNNNDRPRPQLPRELRKSDPLPPSVGFHDLVKSSEVRKKEKGQGKPAPNTD